MKFLVASSIIPHLLEEKKKSFGWEEVQSLDTSKSTLILMQELGLEFALDIMNKHKNTRKA